MQLEEGYYSFRATAINPKGEMQSFYSRSYFISDPSSERIARQDYTKVLQDYGWSNIKITHTRKDIEANNYNYMF